MNIDIKICGITNKFSIKVAAQNNIQSLGFTSNNLPVPNTCNDKKIASQISCLPKAIVNHFNVKPGGGN